MDTTSVDAMKVHMVRARNTHRGVGGRLDIDSDSSTKDNLHHGQLPSSGLKLLSSCIYTMHNNPQTSRKFPLLR